MANMMRSSMRRGINWRVIGWGAAIFLLLLPLAAMQFTDEVKWGPGDFLFAALMFGGFGAVFELAVARSGSFTYRAGVAAALAAAFLIVWSNGAVGIVGNESNPFNLLYFGVVAFGLLTAVAARFRPGGMALAMAATAATLALLAIIAISTGQHRGPESSLPEIFGVTLFLAAPWLVSAGLFRMAADVDAGR